MYTEQIEQIEKHCVPIKFRGIEKEHVKSENLKAFLENEFFAINFVKQSDRVENNTFQCGTNRDRSIGDIYQLCKYYFPEITVVDVIKVIYNSILERKKTDDDQLFVGHYCPTINKRVYNSRNVKTAYDLMAASTRDEFGLTHQDYFKICKHYENAESSQVVKFRLD